MANSLNIDRTGPFQAGEFIRNSNPQWIHQQLMASESYLDAFQKRSEEVFAPGGLLSPEVCRARLNLRVAEIDRAIIAESARWSAGRILTRNHWRNEIDKIYDFFVQREDIVVRHLQSAKRFTDGRPGSRLVPAPLYPGAAAQRVAAPEITVRPDGILFMHEEKDVEIFYTLDGTDPRNGSGAPAESAKPATAERIDYRAIVANAPFRAMVPRNGSLGNRWIQPEFNDLQWMAGRGSAGYETKSRGSRGTLYHDLIGLDLERFAARKNTTVYLRFAFTLQPSESYQRMALRIRYDDGFVAYLNGQEICRANAPEELTWNAVSGGKHDDASAVKFVDFDVSSHAKLLRRGPNVLAIHALNDYLESSDMLTEPKLLAGVRTAGTVIAGGASATVRARARRGTTWSPLARPASIIGANQATAGTLTISELHYHPSDPTDEEEAAGYRDADAFEFIELANTGEQDIDLAVAQFAGGITFVFPRAPESVLRGNSRCVIVTDRSAFRARYGDEPVIAGEYKGKLGNGGDSLRFISADGVVMHSVRYSDKSPWPKAPDGDGPSLELRAVTPGIDLSQPGSWKASEADGGTPGE